MKKIYLVFLTTIVSLTSLGKSIYVSNSGSDDAGDGTIGTPYASIKKAIDNVTADGDEVLVETGTYIGTWGTDVATKKINILGGYAVGFLSRPQVSNGEAWDFVYPTVVKAKKDEAIYFLKNNTGGLIEGFTFTSSEDISTAINTASLTLLTTRNVSIRKCKFVDIASTSSSTPIITYTLLNMYSGGTYNPNFEDCFLEDCLFENNKNLSGAGNATLITSGSSANRPIWSNLTIRGTGNFSQILSPTSSVATDGNIAQLNNIKVYNSTNVRNQIITNGGKLEVTNALIYNNTTGTSGNIIAPSTSSTGGAKFTNCTFVRNRLMNSTEANKHLFYGTAATIYNCVILENQVGSSGTQWGGIDQAGSFTVSNCVLDVERADNMVSTIANARFALPTTVYGAALSDADAIAANWDLLPTSPLINQGSNSFFEGTEMSKTNRTDIAKHSRIQLETIDIGAYESPNYTPIQTVLYVSNNGKATNDGSSWKFAKLSTSVSDAIASAGALRTICFAKGTYNVANILSFQNYAGYSFYGGFSGTDDAEAPETRKRLAGGKAWDFENQTIWKGNGTQSMFVMSNNALGSPIVIDGMVFEGGSGSNSGGVGYLRDGITIRNCIARNNISNGGGAFNFYTTIATGVLGSVIDNCYFYGNKSSGSGGVLSVNTSGNSKLTVSNCKFEENTSEVNGAAVFVAAGTETSTPLFVNNIFVGNSSPITIPASANGAAYYSNSVVSKLVNSLVYNNSGSSVVFSQGEVTNCTVVKNEGGVYLPNNQAKACNNVVWGNVSNSKDVGISGGTNTYLVKNCAYTVDISVESKNAGSSDNDYIPNNSDNSFGFVRPTSFVGLADTPQKQAELAASDWTLKSSSRLINTGANNLFLSSYGTTDLKGASRIYQNKVIDKGAYESLFSPVAPPTPENPDITESTKDPAAVITLEKPATGSVNYVVSSGTQTISALTIKASPLTSETPVELEIRDGASLTVTQDLSLEYDFTGSTNQWLFLSLPFDLNLEGGIRLVNSVSAEREGKAEVDYGFRVYDSANRATGKADNWWNVNQSGNSSNGLHTTLPEGATVLKAGTGFIFYLPTAVSERIVRFYSNGQATLASSVDKGVAYYGGGLANDAGWQLIGLPMTTQAVAMSTTGTSTGLPAFVYAYNGSTYLSERTDSYSMRPFQAYFMQVSDETKDWNFKTVSKTNSVASSAYSTRGIRQSPITFNMIWDGVAIDRSQIHFDSNASEDFVYNEDALKLVFSNENRIATLSAGKQFSYNRRPLSGSSSDITLSSVVRKGSTCKIARLENISDFSSILIRNSRGGASTDLMQSDFTLEEGDQLYTLTFLNTSTGLTEPQAERPFAFFDHQTLRVVGLNGKAALFNTSGLKVWEGEVSAQPWLDLSRGVYFLRVADQEIKIVK